MFDMMNLFETCAEIERFIDEGKKSKHITRDECLMIIELSPFDSATVLKRIITKKMRTCNSCDEVYPTVKYLTEVGDQVESMKLCKDCYLDWYYGL